MKKILVPVDFYKTSFAAYHYAMHLAQELPESEIILLHVINGSFNTNDLVLYDPMEGRKQAVRKRLEYFAEEYAKELGLAQPPVPTTLDVRFGIPGFTIAEYTEQHDIDLVVMGTRDKHSLFDRLLGAASAITIRTATCPVLLIHQNCSYSSPAKAVFAFDAKSDIEDAIEDYKKLNNHLQMTTDFVHVKNDSSTSIEDQKNEIIEELFEKEQPSFSFVIKTIEGDQLSKSLMDYCTAKKVDILAMTHRKEGVFRSLFRTNQSVQIAQEFQLPVLVFHESS